MDEERKERLRQLLNDNHKWPTIYMFKFLMQNDPLLMARLKNVFNESAEIRTRFSERGNYVSITVKEMVMHADTVFERYEAVSNIQGITAL
jgi:uncharacterized protein